jgi:hypothetical protein
MKGKPQNFLCAMIFVLLLSGCATGIKSGDEKMMDIKIQDVLAEAGVAADAGEADKALVILKKATAFFPADKAPWVRIAQIKFDSANYGEAIINAQEALQRDPSDTLANSIVAVSGLRLATKALADLSRENNLSGSVRTEAQDLAKLLRESLGEVALVPVSQRGKTAVTASPKSGMGTHKAAAKMAQGKPFKVPGGGSEGGNSNPFGALK